MSRVAKAHVVVPAGVTVTLSGQDIQVKGPMGELSRTIHSDVVVSQEENNIITNIVADVKGAWVEGRSGSADRGINFGRPKNRKRIGISVYY